MPLCRKQYLLYIGSLHSRRDNRPLSSRQPYRSVTKDIDNNRPTAIRAVHVRRSMVIGIGREPDTVDTNRSHVIILTPSIHPFAIN
jgi:hypothetical protein